AERDEPGPGRPIGDAPGLGRAEKTSRLIVRPTAARSRHDDLRPRARDAERPHAVGQSGRFEPEKPGSATTAVDLPTGLGDRPLDIVALETSDISVCQQRRWAAGNKSRAAARGPWPREHQRLVKRQLTPVR